jgi:hypothetical protein
MAKIPKRGRVLSIVPHTNIPHHYFASIEWVDEEGYRVIGDFELIGWRQCPRAVGEKVQKILSRPPKVLYYGRPRDRSGSR